MAIFIRSYRLLPQQASPQRARSTPNWEPAAAKFPCERLMAAYAWWSNGRASDGANSPTSEDEWHEAHPRAEPCRLELAAVDGGNDPYGFGGPDDGTHSTANHKQSCTSCTFRFYSNSYNTCCARCGVLAT